MAAFELLLHRLGFVKLGRYGLQLTPEGRILSTRTTVLDDGAGGRIVGWEDSDLATVELAPWPSESSARRPPARRFPVPPASPSAARTRPTAVSAAVPVASPAVASAPVPVSAPVAVSGAVTVPVAARSSAVAVEPAVDEDDWEWTIALARARTVGATEPVRRVASTQTSPAGPLPEPATSAEWPATAPVGAIDYADYSHMPTRPAIPIPHVAQARPASVMTAVSTPSTVIPVPRLPSIGTTAQASPLTPVARTIPGASPRRFPKGTADIGPASTRSTDDTKLGVVPAEARTRPMAAQPGPDDHTRPGIALPPAARTVALPGSSPRSPSRSPR